jgi:L,D-peptidoglycan transpeptidase YkuD (ErfK/YbiS/YcfS/YnhG family)
MKAAAFTSGSKAGLRRLLVSRRVSGAPHQGRMIAGTLTLNCALGRAGLTRDKREGDGATPKGRLRLLHAFVRPGRVSRAGLRAATRCMREGDIWCDDPKSFLYNRLLRGPTRLSHEDLWRKDDLYDFVGVLDYNIRPALRGRGSAIFFHVATEGLAPTAGCVALRGRDLARLLPRLARRVTLELR